MIELNSFLPKDLSNEQRKNSTFFVIDESSINCVSLEEIKNIIDNQNLEAFILLPNYQYQKGKKGYAKVQILSSMSNRILGVVAIDKENFDGLISDLTHVVNMGIVKWKEDIKHVSLFQEENNLEFETSNDMFDKLMISKAHDMVNKSNCWLDPAGSVFVRDRKILVSSTSTSYKNSKCSMININFNEIFLDKGERMNFCVATHSEIVGISKAKEMGISLDGADIYITKFPCKPCAIALIDAGIKSIFFEAPSYGCKDVKFLMDNNVRLVKVI